MSEIPTLAQETIVERKGENALERMVSHVLHHHKDETAPEAEAAPAPEAPAETPAEQQDDAEEAAAEAAAIEGLLSDE